MIQKKWDNLMDAKVAKFMKFYPWFSNMSTNFVVAHANFLSIYDVGIQDWNHIELKSEIMTGFRVVEVADKEQGQDKYWAAVVLK